MGLFGGGNSKKTTNNDYFTDQSYTDQSYTDQSYSDSSSDSSQRTDNSVVNITDGGAFDVASDALDSNRDVSESALNVAKFSNQNSRLVSESSLDFGQSVLDRAFDSSEQVFSGSVGVVKDSNRMNQQIVTGALDKSLALAANRSATQSENVMDGVQKIALGLAVVVGIGLVVSRK